MACLGRWSYELGRDLLLVSTSELDALTSRSITADRCRFDAVADPSKDPGARPMSPSSSPRSLHGLALAVAVLLCSSGCARTQVSRVWSDPELKEDRYERVMILVIAASHARRETAEDRIFNLLTKEGVAAVRAYDSIPDDAFGDRERIAEAVKASGADALLAVRVASVDKETEVKQGREQWVPAGTGVDYYGYVVTSMNLYRTPEMYSELKVTAETTLWDVATRRMVWACQSDSTGLSETVTTAELTDDFANVVVKKARPYLKAK